MSTLNNKKNKNFGCSPENVVSDAMDIAARIKKARETLGLTQVKFAQILGVTNSYISEIEKGKNISGNLTRQLADKLNISPNWLLLGREPMLLDENPSPAAGQQAEKHDLDMERLIYYCTISPYVKHSLLSFMFKLLINDRDTIEDDIKNNRQRKE